MSASSAVLDERRFCAVIDLLYPAEMSFSYSLSDGSVKPLAFDETDSNFNSKVPRNGFGCVRFAHYLAESELIGSFNGGILDGDVIFRSRVVKQGDCHGDGWIKCRTRHVENNWTRIFKGTVRNGVLSEGVLWKHCPANGSAKFRRANHFSFRFDFEVLTFVSAAYSGYGMYVFKGRRVYDDGMVERGLFTVSPFSSDRRKMFVKAVQWLEGSIAEALFVRGSVSVVDHRLDGDLPVLRTPSFFCQINVHCDDRQFEVEKRNGMLVFFPENDGSQRPKPIAAGFLRDTWLYKGPFDFSDGNKYCAAGQCTIATQRGELLFCGRVLDGQLQFEDIVAMKARDSFSLTAFDASVERFGAEHISFENYPQSLACAARICSEKETERDGLLRAEILATWFSAHSNDTQAIRLRFQDAADAWLNLDLIRHCGGNALFVEKYMEAHCEYPSLCLLQKAGDCWTLAHYCAFYDTSELWNVLAFEKESLLRIVDGTDKKASIIAAKVIKEAFSHRTKRGMTPLHFACQSGHILSIRKLKRALRIEDFRNHLVTATNSEGFSALQLAAQNGHWHIVSKCVSSLKPLLLFGQFPVYELAARCQQWAVVRDIHQKIAPLLLEAQRKAGKPRSYAHLDNATLQEFMCDTCDLSACHCGKSAKEPCARCVFRVISRF